MSISWEQRVFRIRRILTDAGCSAEQIAAFLEWEQAGDRCRQYKFLARHRACLLDQLHQDAARLDCLDHLVFIMRQAEKQYTDETEGICLWKNNCI